MRFEELVDLVQASAQSKNQQSKNEPPSTCNNGGRVIKDHHTINGGREEKVEDDLILTDLVGDVDRRQRMQS